MAGFDGKLSRVAMLQDLLERGLRVDESILCVVDGGKGIRKALSTFWGISRSSKGARSINSEVFARTFQSLVTPMKEAKGFRNFG